MRRKLCIPIFFILSLFSLISITYAQLPWEKWIPTFEAPPTLSDFLKGFGVPEIIAKDIVMLVFFVLIPILVFLIVLKSILVDEIIVRMMGIGAFRDWRGWIFPLLIIIFLFPTGLIGMFAMWLYAAAGILVIYGFGALLILSVIRRFVGPGKRVGCIAVGVFVGVALAFFNPMFGIIIIILGILMGIGGYSARGPGLLAPYKEATKMGEEYKRKVKYILGRYKEKIPSKQMVDISFEGQTIIRDAFTGIYSKEEIEKRYKAWVDKVKSIAKV